MSPVNHRIVQWIPTWLMCESQWFAIMFPTVSPHLGKFNSEFSCLWEILLVSLSPLSVNFSSASLRYPANFRKTIWAASFYLPSQDDTDLPPKSLKKKDFGQENLPFPCRETQAKASLRRGLSNSALRFRPDFHGNERNSFWWIQDSGWRIHTHFLVQNLGDGAMQPCCHFAVSEMARTTIFRPGAPAIGHEAKFTTIQIRKLNHETNGPMISRWNQGPPWSFIWICYAVPKTLFVGHHGFHTTTKIWSWKKSGLQDGGPSR